MHPIASQSRGSDGHDIFRALISIDDALGLIRARTTAIEEAEDIPLEHALGRTLARPVTAVCMSPPFDNAAMDGYAVVAASLVGDGPWTLDVVERVPAGQAAARPLGGLQTTRIFTGAPIPTGSDAVVMQEDVQRNGATIRIVRRPPPGLNIRRAGSEMAEGATVLGQGHRLGPREIATCAAAGAGFIRVSRRLRVALLVTGDEVRQAGADRKAAQIWDVNTPMLTAALTRPDIDIIAVEHGLDSADTLSAQLAEMAGVADLVITTGGVSVGEEDHIKPTLLAMGAEIIFSGIAIKPGKPVSFGKIRGASWLGLPGNPLAAFITWQLFGEALIRRMAGHSGAAPRKRYVVTAHDISRKAGRCELRPASLVGCDPQGRDVVGFEPDTHSSRVRGLSMASGLIVIPADAAWLPAGTLVEFQPFHPS